MSGKPSHAFSLATFAGKALHGLVAVLIVGLAASAAVAPARAEEPVMVMLDRARVLKVTQPVSMIVIGNPAIADASMPDTSTLVLTGKSYGETNILMLNDAGAVVAEYPIWVGAGGSTMVSVYRRTARQTLSCTPHCEARPMLGDDAESFDRGIAAIQNRNGLAQSYANGQNQ